VTSGEQPENVCIQMCSQLSPPSAANFNNHIVTSR
jgi:hypothetical protein